MKKTLLILLFASISFASFAQTQNADTTLHGRLVSKAPDASYVTYQWTQVSGPASTIVTPTSLITDVRISAAGVYVYQLVGTDNFGIASLPDRVTVTVGREPIKPVIDAGVDIIVQLGSK